MARPTTLVTPHLPAVGASLSELLGGPERTSRRLKPDGASGGAMGTLASERNAKPSVTSTPADRAWGFRDVKLRERPVRPLIRNQPMPAHEREQSFELWSLRTPKQEYSGYELALRPGSSLRA